MPSTLPPSLTMPAIERIDPFGFDAFLVDVPECDAPFALEAIERRRVGGVAPLTVRDRDAQDLPVRVPRGEDRRRALDAELHGLGDERQRRVAKQRAGKEPGFAGDLVAVADGEHRAAAIRVRDHLAHDRAEARDRTGAQIVAVAEAAREDDDVGAGEVGLAVPEVDRFLA